MLDWARVQQMAKLVSQHTGRDQQSAIGMALGQSALNWGVADRLLGPKPGDVTTQLSSLTADKLHDLMTLCMDPAKQFVTVLVPAEEAE